jgi:hypothetical protein
MPEEIPIPADMEEAIALLGPRVTSPVHYLQLVCRALVGVYMEDLMLSSGEQILADLATRDPETVKWVGRLMDFLDEVVEHALPLQDAWLNHLTALAEEEAAAT